IDDLGLVAKYLRLDAERELHLLHAERLAAPQTGERPRQTGVTRQRRDGELAVAGWSAALYELQIEPGLVAQGVKAFPGEGLEPAMGVLEPRAHQQDTPRPCLRHSATQTVGQGPLGPSTRSLAA